MGREDRITPPELAERFHGLLLDAQLWFLPRCGHAPMLERPEAFIEIVAGWPGEQPQAEPDAGAPARRPATIGRAAGAPLDRYAGHRRRQLERIWRDPVAVQEAAPARLVAKARGSEFALAHGFQSIRTVADYQARVPVREYQELKPLWERALLGERSITWPGR